MTRELVEVKFKRYDRRFPRLHGAWDDEGEEVIYCRLYEPLVEYCRNPQKKCKNCSTYHGFRGSGRLKVISKFSNILI